MEGGVMPQVKVTESRAQKAADTRRRSAASATSTARRAVDTRVRNAAGNKAVLSARAKRAWKTRKKG